MDENGSRPKTMFEKIWDAHVVRDVPGESTILYIDRHLVHEATSPQAFAGLRMNHLPVRRPDATIAVLDLIVTFQANPPSCTSTAISCMQPPRRRPSPVCA